MTCKLEFHFDFGSPNAYLSHKVLPAIEARSHRSFDYVPVLLGGVFKLTNNRSPMQANEGIRNKNEYEFLEMRRFIERHGLAGEFEMNPHFPVNTLHIMRGAVAARQLSVDIYKTYIDTVFTAMWRDQRKMDDPAVIGEVLAVADLPVESLMSTAGTEAVKSELMQLTNDSVERGNFGSPTFFINNDMYFGKDRLRDVEEIITKY
ncbi:MAG: 2-hydroxychromene-2-carboxylate isomerase [Parahaliea sp.]